MSISLSRIYYNMYSKMLLVRPADTVFHKKNWTLCYYYSVIRNVIS